MSEAAGEFSLDTIKRLIGEAYKHSPAVKERVDKILGNKKAPGGKKKVTTIENGKEITRHVGNRKNKFIAEYNDGSLNSFDRTKDLTLSFTHILWKHITQDTASYNRSAGLRRDGLKNFPKSAIIAKLPKKSERNEDGSYTATISLNPNLVRRASLTGKGGIDNILQLFLTGYRARRTVGGVWVHSNSHQSAVVGSNGQPKRVGSLKYRPNANTKHFYPRGNFLKNAIREFNSHFAPGGIAYIISNDFALGQPE